MSSELLKRHKIPVAAKHLQMEADTALKNDIARALAELIKNSVDSINRGRRKDEPVSEQVNINYYDILGKLKFEVIDNAEGMSFEKLELATRHGEDVSGLSEGEHVHGLFGAGLKHVMCSMEESETISIRDNKISSCKFFQNWERDFPIRDKEVDDKTKKKISINKNGTYNTFVLPEKWKKPQSINKLGKKLDCLYLLRLINLNEDFKVILHDKASNKTRRIEYKEPKSETFLDEKFKIYHKEKGKFNVKIIIKIANEELERNVDDYSNRGLIIHNEDGVAYDHTLFKYNNEYFANRIFGYVEVKNFNEILKNDKTVLAVHRLGLNYQHPFCRQLKEEIEKRLEQAFQKEKKERQSKKDYESFQNLSSEALKELSKLYQELVGDGGGGEKPPKEPKTPEGGIEFYPKQTTLLENIKKRIYLIVNKKKIKENQKIFLTKQNSEKSIVFDEEIVYNPNDKYKDKDFDIMGINIIGSIPDRTERVAASSDDCNSCFIDINVEEDPKQNLENGIGFYPDNANIVESERRNLNLYIDTSKIKKNIVKITSTNPKNIKVITNMLNLDKGTFYTADIKELKVAVIGRGVGETGEIIANLDGVECRLKAKVVHKKLEGIFRDAKLVSDREPEIRASQEGDPKEGYIINVHRNNPIINLYTQGEYKKSKSFWTIFSDTVVTLATHLIARDLLEKEKIAIGAELSADEIESKRLELEYKYGLKIHQVFLSRLQKEKMLDEE